jgi:hypothetical protein
MKKVLLVALVLLSLAFTIYFPKTKGSYPKHYFQPPVAHTLLLSGTFGELRPNHLHAGIDIKSSKGAAGDPVFAAGAGYISRIKIEASGYGNSLSIAHPNGYTTVYAHLEKFTDELEAYIRQQQYALRSFEVELQPDEKAFPVSQGEQIGIMGNSGSSNGAHLHFEVRETSTQNPINPLLFGFNVTDNIPPKMHSLKVYSLNEKREEKGDVTFNLVKAGNDFRIKGDTITIGAWQAGFALKVYDHLDRVSNWNGIYELNMYQNDSLVYDFDLESFAFDESRYVNAHCDYEERVTKNSYFNRCYTLPGNRLSIYKRQVNYGVIKLQEKKAQKITIIAWDVTGNSSKLEFWTKRGPVPAQAKQEVFNYILPYNEGNMIRTEGIYLHFPQGILYENLYLKYQSTPDRSHGYYSNVHHLHNSITPVHDYFDIGIRPTFSIPAELKPKVFVAYCEGGSVVNCGGRWVDGLLRAKARELGDYAIMADVTPPVIKPIAFSTNMKGFNKMVFKITDNIETAPNVENMTYVAKVDGEWLLMEYDKKNKTITHRFDERTTPGEHQIRLVVQDAVGNETVYESKFER